MAPPGPLGEVKCCAWHNIRVLGPATSTGVDPGTLALVGRARYMADGLGGRVEVLLIGEELDIATEALRKYPIDTVYRVKAPEYAAIDHTARILEAVVRKRRPELVLVFQSRTGDAVTAYAANQLGVGFVTGVTGFKGALGPVAAFAPKRALKVFVPSSCNGAMSAKDVPLFCGTTPP